MPCNLFLFNITISITQIEKKENLEHSRIILPTSLRREAI